MQALMSVPKSYTVRRTVIIIELVFLGFLVLGRALGAGGAIPEAPSAAPVEAADGGAAGAP